jgi:hypothetical protein
LSPFLCGCAAWTLATLRLVPSRIAEYDEYDGILYNLSEGIAFHRQRGESREIDPTYVKYYSAERTEVRENQNFSVECLPANDSTGEG